MSMKLTPPQVHYRAWYKHEKNIQRHHHSSFRTWRQKSWMDRNEGHSEANPSRRWAHILIKACSCNVHAIWPLPPHKNLKMQKLWSFIAGVQMITIGSECRHCSMYTHIPSKKQVCRSQTWTSLKPQIADSPGLLKVKELAVGTVLLELRLQILHTGFRLVRLNC